MPPPTEEQHVPVRGKRLGTKPNTEGEARAALAVKQIKLLIWNSQ